MKTSDFAVIAESLNSLAATGLIGRELAEKIISEAWELYKKDL